MSESKCKATGGDQKRPLSALQRPLISVQLSAGIRIEDLQQKRFEDALNFIQKWYVPEEPLCRGTDLEEDAVSLQQFLDLMLQWIGDLTSLVAIEERENTIVGIIVNRINWKLGHSRTQSKLRIVEGEALQKINKLLIHVSDQLDVYDHYDVDSYLKVYGLCVRPMFRGKGVGMALLESSVTLARHLGQRTMMGTFTSSLGQRLAQKLGMRVHYTVAYSSWTSEEEFGFSVFRDVGAANYFAALMGMRVSPKRQGPRAPDLETRLRKLLAKPV